MAFGMRIIALTRGVSPERAQAMNIDLVDLDQAAEPTSSPSTAKTPGTIGLIGEDLARRSRTCR